jgi:hypothetical protein
MAILKLVLAALAATWLLVSAAQAAAPIPRAALPTVGAATAMAGAADAAAQEVNRLSPGGPSLERPTLRTLGVRLPFSGDADGDASVTVRVRRRGQRPWRRALPLFRVDPSTVRRPPGEVPAVSEFSGSLFRLRPRTSYEILLTVADPDGSGRRRIRLRARTRGAPRGPARPRVKRVASSAQLQAALDSARPGEVISLAPGVYQGSFAIQASGTQRQPIVVRGATRDSAVLDGGGCEGCNVLEVYGSFVQVERLTLRNAERALRLQGDGSRGNVIRHVRILDTTLGIGAGGPQLDSYICDNLVEGRLRWPLTYSDDDGEHSDDEGIVVWGEGNVVCHNRVSGYGDALNVSSGDRATDFYGNEIRSAYDNAIELDGAHGNVRFFENRVENAYAPMSAQPVAGGPAYFVRNVVLNIADEQLKFKAVGEGAGAREPSGVLVYNNTFVSPYTALLLQTPETAHQFRIENNIFFGPAPRASPWWPEVVHWTGQIDRGVFDYNGYYPDGGFRFADERFASFAALRRSRLEAHGVLLGQRTFARLSSLRDHRPALRSLLPVLARRSRAIDRGRILAGITDGYRGKAPDLGALEAGAGRPRYGIRRAPAWLSGAPRAPAWLSGARCRSRGRLRSQCAGA